MKYKMSLKSLLLAFVAFALLFAGIGMVRRNSLRYRAEMVASANAKTLPPDLTGDFVWRYHINGGWDTRLTLNDDGTFQASQDHGVNNYIRRADGTYSISGRILKLRYRRRPMGWNSHSSFHWAAILEVDGTTVLFPDRCCEKWLVGEESRDRAGGLCSMHYMTREDSIESVRKPLQTLVGQIGGQNPQTNR